MISTALAPSEATIHGGDEAMPNECANSATTAMHMTMPNTMRQRSRWLMRTRAGLNRRNHTSARLAPGSLPGFWDGGKNMERQAAPRGAAHYQCGLSAMCWHGYWAGQIRPDHSIEWPGYFFQRLPLRV